MLATKASTFTHRSSVACTTCRDRHVHCDGTRPCCTHCSSEARVCEYTPSRRGGLTRAELAARRAAKDRPSSTTGVRCCNDAGSLPGRRRAAATAVAVANTSTVTTPSSYHRDVWAHVLSNKARRGELEPLLACMRFIGSLYAKSDQATELGESVRLDIHTRGDLNPDPALAQCRLLYSIGTYWCGDRDTSRREMDAALGIAIGLGMHCREFTIENSGSGEDPSIYTWLMRGYAAIRKKPTFATRNVHITADLPCEEREYESGTIPTPKTLDEFDSREFSPENHVYSSFAYLIGATARDS
ncbi:hypothetical protein PoMZ_07423 [Pyricularia oryzae]|uniref:Zn(2)-C6 fungal-type domain-containing protein n=1 Tax=Pyricularia oryzae TaxID=318829 RepID=A0A4P7NF49_PYROR|nr:hypothetical protein PoMZ_07423 [Pyricularia oryzae]